MLLILVFCGICPAVLSSDVQTVLPENYDTKPVDKDEYGVRNYVSDHELPKDVPTRVKIVGDLGTPPPSVKLDFVPKQTYVQVRRYDAVKRLPQEVAMEEAATSEEKANAPRLREVVTHKKTQEVYEEQGYEDAGYDHGGSKKLKIEEEVKDNQSKEVIKPKTSSTQETKDHTTSVAPSGRGTWSRHKTTTGKKTRLEEDGDKRKLTTNDGSPINEKSSGNYTKFDGGKTIIVQNLTETEKKDYKKEGAESRRVASISKTVDKLEPTTYRPIVRHDSTRHTTKQNRNEQKRSRNRNRNRPRKRQEHDAHKVQTDVVGSYDNSPWIPISPPTDYQGPREIERPERKKRVKSNTNTEFQQPNSQTTKFGYTVNHNTPYKYVFPTDLLSPDSSSKPNRKLRPTPEKLDFITSGKPKGLSYAANHDFIPQTNYDGSAINLKQNKMRKPSEQNVLFDTINFPLSNTFKEPSTQFKTDLTQSIKQDVTATNQRQKYKPVEVGSLEYFNSNLKPELYREQIKNEHKHIGTELGNTGISGSRFTSSVATDFGPPKSYDAPFITRLKKNNFNVDSRGDPTLRVYPKYEFYPSYQNVKQSVTDEIHHEQRPMGNIKGNENVRINQNPLRNIKHENTRLSEHPKFNNNNNRPTIIYKQSAGSLENYPKTRGPISHLSEEKYSKFNKGENYPKFESNEKFESSGTKLSPTYRLTPYENSAKISNPYSYVYYDDQHTSGSHYNGVKVEATTQSPTLNNRHPHLPKDSIKNNSNVNISRDKSQDENARHVENLTLAHFSGFRKSSPNRPLALEYNERVNNLAKLLNDNYPKRTRRDLEVINIASSGTTTEIPVDTVVYPHYKNAPKESALRYATNPNLTPQKTAGGMEFYASTDKVQCIDDIAPNARILPERSEDGEWKGEPSNNNGPKIDALGDKIGCFKTKYFGSDPLDNPFFKEKDVGFPDVLFSINKPAEKVEASVQPGKPHVDWDFADELIPSNWFPDKDKRSRRLKNNSIPINHKIQGMASIIPEPVILTFPTKASMVVFKINQTKLDTENIDSEVSSNDEHIIKYSIKHPSSKPEMNIFKNSAVDNKIVGLFPPPQKIIAKRKNKKPKKVKKTTMKKILKKVKVIENSNEEDLLDVFSPITSFFADDDNAMVAPIVHNFFNIKMTPSEKIKTTIKVNKNNEERVNKLNVRNYRRTKRNIIGVDLQKPKQRKLNINSNTNVTLSSPTARVRMYSPKNGTWFRDKRYYVSVNVDERRNEPRYYYRTDQPRVRVKRVVHNNSFDNKSSEMFSSKYLVTDQDKSETMSKEINIELSKIPKHNISIPKFIPAIAFGDNKTKIINYNDSVANSTSNVAHSLSDKNDSLIYVINPDTGLGKWMKVIKVANDGNKGSEPTNGSVFLEKKIIDGLANNFFDKVKNEENRKSESHNSPVNYEKKMNSGQTDNYFNKVKNQENKTPEYANSPIFIENKINHVIPDDYFGNANNEEIKKPEFINNPVYFDKKNNHGFSDSIFGKVNNQENTNSGFSNNPTYFQNKFNHGLSEDFFNKIKNEENKKPEFTNNPVYFDKKNNHGFSDSNLDKTNHQENSNNPNYFDKKINYDFSGDFFNKIKNDENKKPEFTNNGINFDKKNNLSLADDIFSKIKNDENGKSKFNNKYNHGLAGGVFSKIKNEENKNSALTNRPSHSEKKTKNDLASESFGTFGFHGSAKDVFKSVFGPNLEHRFKFPSKELKNNDGKQTKTICPHFVMPKVKEIKSRVTTTTTEIPVVEELDDTPEGHDENENTRVNGNKDGSENEDEHHEEPEEQYDEPEEHHEEPQEQHDEEEEQRDEPKEEPHDEPAELLEEQNEEQHDEPHEEQPEEQHEEQPEEHNEEQNDEQHEEQPEEHNEEQHDEQHEEQPEEHNEEQHEERPEEQHEERPEEQHEERPEEQHEERLIEKLQEETDSKLNSDNAEDEDDQDGHKFKQNRPRVKVKKPESKGYFYGSRIINKDLL